MEHDVGTLGREDVGQPGITHVDLVEPGAAWDVLPLACHQIVDDDYLVSALK
jgi:hypothetical protein